MKILNFNPKFFFFKWILISGSIYLLQSCSVERLYNLNHLKKSAAFEQVDFKNMVERYLQKEIQQNEQIEGLYSVSILVTKRYKPFLSSVYKIKTLDERQNYSYVAIIKENNKNTGREYIEIPIDKGYLPSYSIRGEFTSSPEGGILVYKHFEKKDQAITYTFSTDIGNSLLEGIRTENKGSSTITYKLSYLKLLPKGKIKSNE